MRRLLLIVLIAISWFTIAPAMTAQAAPISLGASALNWAEANATGHPYVWGGTGPGGYDCSGLVSTAVLKADGVWIGRDTYEMLATMGHGHFRRVPLDDIQRGDVLFYGSGHVEFATRWYHTSYGAHDSDSPVGWIQWGSYWYPTMAFQIVGDG